MHFFLAALGFSTGIASAEPARLTVDFGFFPAGTECQVFNTSGRVGLRVGREIEFTINGDTANVSFVCQQPDGRSFQVDTGPLLPPGDHRLVAVQINQDNNAIVLWDQGGLMRQSYPGILRWQ